MKTSESIIKIAAALLAAQKKIGSASKDAVNPFFKSKYADLGAVMEACKEALNDNGISALQPVGTSEMGTTVETILLHESGEWISDTMTVSVKQSNDPQAQGSAITYARRYSLQSMMFIPAEDDDGERATQHAAPRSNYDKGGKITDKQKEFLISLYKQKNFEDMPEDTQRKIENLSFDKASVLITEWKEKLTQPVPDKQVDEITVADVQAMDI